MDTAYTPFIKANYPNPYMWKSYWFGVLVHGAERSGCSGFRLCFALPGVTPAAKIQRLL